MADIIDSDSTNDELQEFDNVDNLGESQEPAVKNEPENDLPEKFKGKSTKDIVKAYEEIEKLAGRQAQEVGELRKLTDEILKNQLKATQPEPQAQEVDFFDDPKEAVNKVVENHPAVKEALRNAAEMKAAKVKQQLTEQFGDPEEFGKDPEFVAWVKGSKVRMALAAQAQNYDYDAAAELLSTYKEIKSVRNAKANEQAQEIQSKQKQSLKAASVDMSSGTGESSKKIYRRADLIRLMQTDPKRYEALQPEIMAAYVEGRVK
jgi:hypothetical protein